MGRWFWAWLPVMVLRLATPYEISCISQHFGPNFGRMTLYRGKCAHYVSDKLWCYLSDADAQWMLLMAIAQICEVFLILFGTNINGNIVAMAGIPHRTPAIT
jgi:hypothetical protein